VVRVNLSPYVFFKDIYEKYWGRLVVFYGKPFNGIEDLYEFFLKIKVDGIQKIFL